MLIMNDNYFKKMEDKFKVNNMSIGDLPLPCKGVPLTQQEYDYKTFYTQKYNEAFNSNGGEVEEEGKVYLIRNEEGRQKIGMTKNLKVRIKSLSMASGQELTLVTTYCPHNVEYNKLERMLHNHYSDKRGIGEWFHMEVSAEEFLEVCLDLDK